jgi:hypothetical protein
VRDRTQTKFRGKLSEGVGSISHAVGWAFGNIRRKEVAFAARRSKRDAQI